MYEPMGAIFIESTTNLPSPEEFWPQTAVSTWKNEGMKFFSPPTSSALRVWQSSPADVWVEFQTPRGDSTLGGHSSVM